MYFADIIFAVKEPIRDYMYMKKMIKKINKDIADIENQRFFVKTRLVRFGVARFTCFDRVTAEKEEFYSTFHAMESNSGPWLWPFYIYDRINNFIIKQRKFFK